MNSARRDFATTPSTGRPYGGAARGSGNGKRRPSSGALFGAALLCAAILAMALGASAALANRTFDSKISEFRSASSAALDSGGNIWISDAGQEIPHKRGSNGIYEYNQYPSQTPLDIPDTSVAFGGILVLQLAVDQSNGEIFAAQSNGRTVDIFAENGEFLREWDSINGVSSGGNSGAIHIAIDNTNSFSRGRVYLSLSSPENDVEAVDAAERPVDFPASASYITDNRLTGTPSGRFGHVEDIAVDGEGNVYVSDTENEVVDEFDSTGIFLRSFPVSGKIAIDPTNGNVLIAGREFDSVGNHLPALPTDQPFAVNSAGYLYAGGGSAVEIFTPAAILPKVTYEAASDPTSTSGDLHAMVDPNGGGEITGCHFEYGLNTSYGLGSIPCSPEAEPYQDSTPVSAEISALTTETTYHYRVAVTNANGTTHGADQSFVPHAVVGLSTDAATNVGAEDATLNGSLLGDGTDTHYYFEWGRTPEYGNVSAPPPGVDIPSPAGPSATPLSFNLTGLAPYSTYHYRVVAVNGAGTSVGVDRAFTTTPGVPSVEGLAASDVHSDRAALHVQVNPNGADSTVRFEFVDDHDFQESGFANATTAPVPSLGVGMGKHYQEASTPVNGLEPGTVYHYRAVGTNEAGSGEAERTFTTFSFTASLSDPCPNAHVRQQTGAALLLDCRAYELVSAANTGGYDVESGLVPGETPYAGYPGAENPSQVLYGIHEGALSLGEPTNHGVDPYVATRGEHGWTTKYVGIPAGGTPSTQPFASTLEEADAGLNTLAFGGGSICSPCFADGSTGNPIHLPNGELVQGMAGSIPQPDAKPAGFIGKHFSADGSHFVFGSTSQFEPDGNNNGDLSIYDRNLNSEETQVVSKTPAGQTMSEAGGEIGELDISADGSRIVIGQLIEEEGSARYWHLYMNIGDSAKTIDLTPGTTSGVLYDGMNEDGSKVFFTSTDQLLPADTDHSADLYEAEVNGEGQLNLKLVSTGIEGAGNTDACDPSANTKHVHWNTTGSEESCGIVAVGGGGGVAKDNGTVFFLSPELLDGSGRGVQNAPNLYVARPGQPPHFVATLESSSNAPLPASVHPFLRSFGAFENPGGLAIDHATGDTYVFDVGVEAGTGYVFKFDPSGHPVLSFGTNGKLTMNGPYGLFNLPTGIAVDNDPSSPNYGDLYVPDFLQGVIKKFDPSGVHISDISAGGFPAGVAVDQSNGNLYVADGFFGASVHIFSPAGAAIQSFEVAELSTTPTGIAVDSSGDAYVVNGGGYEGVTNGTTEVYSALGTPLKKLASNSSYGVAVDPSDDHIFIDEGSQVTEFDASFNPIGTVTGSGLLSGSFGLTADSGNLEVSNPSKTNVDSYGPAEVPSGPATDNPLVVDSVSSPGVRNTADFQVTPSGDDAIFTSTLPLTGYDNAVHREIYRYDAPSHTLDCASCNPTGEQATGEAALASNGLSLSEDGRVFFNSTEGLVDRDLNNRTDVYEWEKDPSYPAGTVQLISTGTSSDNSSLLGSSADGTDVYFFTRDTPVSTDHNGSTVKVYDARAGGGFPQVPTAIPCQASDECHGPSSQIPPPPNIETLPGRPVPSASQSPTRCKKGSVRKHGRCVKSRKQHHRKAASHG